MYVALGEAEIYVRRQLSTIKKHSSHIIALCVQKFQSRWLHPSAQSHGEKRCTGRSCIMPIHFIYSTKSVSRTSLCILCFRLSKIAYIWYFYKIFHELVLRLGKMQVENSQSVRQPCTTGLHTSVTATPLVR